MESFYIEVHVVRDSAVNGFPVLLTNIQVYWIISSDSPPPGTKGTAYTLITIKDKDFAGHLVRNLEGANQYVPQELLDLALQVSGACITTTVFSRLIAAAIIQKLQFDTWKKFYKIWVEGRSISHTPMYVVSLEVSSRDKNRSV